MVSESILSQGRFIQSSSITLINLTRNLNRRVKRRKRKRKKRRWRRKR